MTADDDFGSTEDADRKADLAAFKAGEMTYEEVLRRAMRRRADAGLSAVAATRLVAAAQREAKGLPPRRRRQ